MLLNDLDSQKQKSRKGYKISLIFAILLLLSFATFYYFYSLYPSQADDEVARVFEQFQQKYERKYGFFEHSWRFNIFKKNYNFIKEHNADMDKTFTLEINNFADMTKEELQNYMGIKSMKLDRESLNEKFRQKRESDMQVERKLSKVPLEIDWVEKGAVPAIRNQMSCGSCWSFAGTSTIESAYYIKHNKILDLSEQQAVDCSFKYGDYGEKNSGCNGGYTTGLYDYYTEYKIEMEKEYPYVSGITGQPDNYEDSICQYQKGHGVTRVSQYYSVNQNLYVTGEIDLEGNEENLKSWVAEQPVAIYLYASCEYFYFYSRGVVNKDCPDVELDHAVVAVGYGYRDGLKYWRVRNSWGKHWGENGYVYIARKDDQDSQGLFGMAYIFMYPVLE